MKRHIAFLLSALLLPICITARAVVPQVTLKCQPRTYRVPDTGGRCSVAILYDNASGTISAVPDIVRTVSMSYDRALIEKIDFPTSANAVITFKQRPDGARTEGEVLFDFIVRVPAGGLPDISNPQPAVPSDPPQYVEVSCQCTFMYVYPALTGVIGGVIAASDKEYLPGQSVERIRSQMPAMSLPARKITYSWQRRTGAQGWQTIAGATAAEYMPQPLGGASEFYRRAAYDGYATAYSNQVEIRAWTSAGVIGLEDTDAATEIRLIDIQSPTVPAAQCRWERSEDNDTWTLLGRGYAAMTVDRPTKTTYYRRVAASLDGKNEYASNTAVYNLFTPVYTLVRTATDAAGTSHVDDRAYYDGLGRPLQNIAVGAAPDGKDIVSFSVYDSYGRQADAYLPFACDASGKYLRNVAYKQDAYYKRRYGAQSTCYPFTHTVFDAAPTNRPLTTVRPGAEYRTGDGHAVECSYGVNAPSELWRIEMAAALNAAGGITVKGYHPAATLAKSRVEDEDGAVTETFTDAEGRTVLSRRVIGEGDYADTYYVYDMLGRLRWAISPEGSARLAQGKTYAVTSELAKKYCFRYKYDKNGNVCETYIPGRDEPDRATYDDAGRLTASSTGAMCSDALSETYRYDALGRLTAVRTKGQSTDTPGMLYSYDSYLSGAEWSGHGFLAVEGVVGQSDLLAVPRGMKTHERIYELADKGAAAPRSSRRTFYYDARGRIVQAVETSPMGRTVRTSCKYDYTGNILLRHEQYTIDGTTTVVAYAYTYDSRGRVTRQKTSVDGTQIADLTYTYDDLGQINSVKAANDIQTAYTYDIQGRLTRKSTTECGKLTIITPGGGGIPLRPGRDSLASLGTPERLGDLPLLPMPAGAPIFEQRLAYSSPEYAAPRYAGNISETSWSRADTACMTYVYAYDRLGRLVDGHCTAGTAQSTKHYGERNITYDRNSNILSLDRYNGAIAATSYRYTYDGNRILTVGTCQTSSVGQTPMTEFAYRYDLMGNVAFNGAEALQVTYNYRNLPKRATKADMRASTGNASTYAVGVAAHVVQNLYLADGTKVRATNDRGRGYEYLGSLRLNVNGEKADIESIPFAGGRIVKTTSGYEPHYYVTDHLGSTRAIVRPAAAGVEIMAEYDYMPYGTQHTVAEAPTADADYKYTGKEQQGAFGMYSLYDSQARFQNVTSGCFLSQDPLSTKFPETTPYIYCGGDPINRTDPDGRMIDDYFNYNGEYLGTDNSSTDHVRIIRQDTWNMLASIEGINAISLQSSSELFSDAQMSDESVLNVYDYYNMTGERIVPTHDNSAVMTTNIKYATNGLNPEIIIRIQEIFISVNINYRKSGRHNNSNNIINIFEHEYDHAFKARQSPQEYHDTPSPQRELSAIIRQISTDTFTKTTKEHKLIVLRYAIDAIKNLFRNN